VDELKGRRDLYNGFGDTLARGIELALTPAIFGVGGYFVDRYFGILPVCTLLFTLVCVVGMFVRTYYAYEAAIAKESDGAPWSRQSPLGDRDDSDREDASS
jgi:hypothetical protein